MYCIHNPSTDPYFNLAAEEYLLLHESGQYFLLWRNAPAIIIGRNQNAHAEINEDYVRDKNIPVVRRISGGGAVFHDLGNINFTFITNLKEQKKVDFESLARPVVQALNRMGVPARFEGRNDLTIHGRKFSGNAQHISKNRVLHHGTLLYDANVTDLSKALRPDELKFRDKAVKSVHKRITNISSHLPRSTPIEDFTAELLQAVGDRLGTSKFLTFTESQEKDIYALREDKYAKWEWNFGTTPPYTHHQKIRTQGGTVEMVLNVRKGRIRTARFYGDFFGSRDISELTCQLEGIPHERSALDNVLRSLDLSQYMYNVNLEEILQLMEY